MSTDTNYSITLKSKDSPSLKAAASYIEILSTPWHPGRRDTKTKVQIDIFRNESNSRGFLDPETLCGHVAEMFPCVSILFSSRDEHGQCKEEEWPGKGPVKESADAIAAAAAFELIISAVSEKHERVPWLAHLKEWAAHAGLAPKVLKKIDDFLMDAQKAEEEFATTRLEAKWQELETFIDQEDKQLEEIFLWQFHPFLFQEYSKVFELEHFGTNEEGRLVWKHQLGIFKSGKNPGENLLFVGTGERICSAFSGDCMRHSEGFVMLRGFDHHNHLIGKAKDEGFNEDQRETLRNREQKKVAERLKGKAALFTMTTPKDCYLFERDSPGVLGGGFLWVGLTRQKVSGSVGIFCVNLESGKKESVREINMEALNHLFMSADQRQLFIIGHPGAEGTPGWKNTFKIVCLGTKDKTNHWETCFPVDQHIVGAAAGDKGVLILLSKRKTDGWNTKHLSGDLVCLNPLTGAKQWDLPLAQRCGGLFGGGFASGLVTEANMIFFTDSTKIYSASWEGKIHWSTPLPDAILERADNNSNTAVESLCLTGDGRLIVSAFGVLACFETKQGRLAWIATDHDARTGPVVGPDGTGYLSTFSILKAINLQDGKLKWSADFSEDQDVLVGGCRPPVITKDGKVYFQTNVCLRSVDAQTGSLQWRINLTNYGTHCSPLVDDQGRILVWAQDPPGIFCLNVKCGGLEGPWPRLGCDAQNSNFLEN